jgi:beta-galactosidase/beta-glucuronidase
VRLGSTIKQVTVPANIDFTYGLSIWTRTFNFPGRTRPNVALLSIGGIVNTAVVKLNGSVVGQLTAFTPALLDIRSALIVPGANTLEFTLDDRLTEKTVPGGRTAPYYQTFGNIAYTFPVAWANKPGVIRSVSVIYSQQALITDVKVMQTFDAGLSSVDVRTTLQANGMLTTDTRALVAFTLNGAMQGQCTATQVQPGVLQCTTRIASPRLWSPAAPTLYDMSAVLIQGSAILDAGRDRVGMRKFEVRGTRFYLNNAPIFLRGISRHDIYGSRHFVADDSTVQQDLVRIKALGVNFIRSIHYPPDEMFVRRADEYGLLVAEEIPAWADLNNTDVRAIASSMLRSVMDRDFNRSSVVMYFVATINDQRPDAFLDSLIELARQTDSSRLVSFLFDDATYTPAHIAANVAYARQRKAHFYAQNCYWHPDIFRMGEASFPNDMPFLNTEWSGSEGSDRGPLGSGNTKSFPDNDYPYNGMYAESFEATKLAEAFNAFFPYVCTASRTTRCMAGTVYFNWQDVDWPGMPYFYASHYPIVRNGLVYEDRVGKAWPLAMFNYLVRWLN